MSPGLHAPSPALSAWSPGGCRPLSVWGCRAGHVRWCREQSLEWARAQRVLGVQQGSGVRGQGSASRGLGPGRAPCPLVQGQPHTPVSRASGSVLRVTLPASVRSRALMCDPGRTQVEVRAEGQLGRRGVCGTQWGGTGGSGPGVPGSGAQRAGARGPRPLPPFSLDSVARGRVSAGWAHPSWLMGSLCTPPPPPPGNR